MTATEEIRRMFDLLRDWRHLPAYQFERRIDPFFAICLPHVLRKYCNMEMHELLIPEFPLKKNDSYQSMRVDYFAITKDGKCAFLIELKTDMLSLSDKQDHAYVCAKRKGLRRIIDEIICIRRHTQQRQKYDNLLRLLGKLELVRVDEEKREIKDRYSNTVGQPEPEITVLYIQPAPSSNKNCITFHQFADAIKGYGEIATLFADYLRRWADVTAGDQDGESNSLPDES